MVQSTQTTPRIFDNFFITLCCRAYAPQLFRFTTLFPSCPQSVVLDTLGSVDIDVQVDVRRLPGSRRSPQFDADEMRSEHTSELQSRGQLVCRLLLEKKKSSCLNTK